MLFLILAVPAPARLNLSAWRLSFLLGMTLGTLKLFEPCCITEPTSDLSMATSEKRLAQTGLAQKSRPSAAPTVSFGREMCNDLAAAEQREWLVTNGIGGFASGTVSGNLTRRYHGLLIAALNPPVGRTQLVAKVEEVADYAGSTCSLATNRWNSGATEPRGYVHIQNFRLEGTVPV